VTRSYQKSTENVTNNIVVDRSYDIGTHHVDDTALFLRIFYNLPSIYLYYHYSNLLFLFIVWYLVC